MGRAGGGGGRVGGGRSGGGSFSRSGGGRSFSGGSRPGGSFGGHSSFGGPSHRGPVHHGPMHHGPMHHGPMHHRPHHHHHHHGGFLFGPWFWGPRYGYGRTVIINNGGNNGGYTGGTYTSQNAQGTYESANTYTEPKPMTADQKINQAEKFQQEATGGKKNALKVLAVAAIVFALGLFVSFMSKQNGYVKAELAGTIEAGYAYDDEFTYNGGKTEAACVYFYEKTGIPLFFYTVGEYEDEYSTCDDYTMQQYDALFRDENHVLVAYYDNVDWWSWAIGENASEYMGEYEVNELIDTILSPYIWQDYNLSNDAALAKGIRVYADELTEGNKDAKVFAVFLYIAAGIVAVVAVISYANNRKDEKYYEEELDKLRMEKMRGE